MSAAKEMYENVEYSMNMRNYNKSHDVSLAHAKQLRQNEENGSTIELFFNTKGIQYITAGNLAIYAENSAEHVEKFAQLMGYDLSQTFMLRSNENFQGRNASMNISQGFYSIREALTRFVSLTGPLTKKVLKEFANKCEST